jgi:hypothetical protein
VPGCYPGSPDPRCGSPSQPPQTYLSPETSKSQCYPDSKDPKCKPVLPPQYRCYPGSPNPQCNEIVTTLTPTTLKAPGCYPGSSDRNCTSDGSAYYETELKPPHCFPGSSDPKCRQTEPPTQQIPTDGSALFPVPILPSTPASFRPSQHDNGDFHGKDQDPRYHAFHSCKYCATRQHIYLVFSSSVL